MRKIAKTYEIEFLNLGYLPNKNEIILQNNIDDIALKSHYYLYEKALSLCPLYPKLEEVSLIDVGCGIGGGLRSLKNHHPEIDKIVGVDQCIHRCDDLDLREGNAESLPFEDCSFDIALNVESSHLYKNPQQFFHEVYRVLSPNGFLCWADLRPVEKANEPFEQAKNSGFEIIYSECINEQVLNGIKLTAFHYDKKLSKTPCFIRMFSQTFRTTYCAPGTKTYNKILNGQTIYQTACWKKQ